MNKTCNDCGEILYIGEDECNSLKCLPTELHPDDCDCNEHCKYKDSEGIECGANTYYGNKYCYDHGVCDVCEKLGSILGYTNDKVKVCSIECADKYNEMKKVKND